MNDFQKQLRLFLTELFQKLFGDQYVEEIENISDDELLKVMKSSLERSNLRIVTFFTGDQDD